MGTSSDGHRHHWTTKSTHPTSEGRLRYQQCACDRWRIAVAHETEVVSRVFWHREPSP